MMKFTLLYFDELASTNTEALEQARRGAAEGVGIVARSQTGGRGRHGRTWVSEKDAGLFFSVILRPKIEPALLSLVTLTTAVAVHDMLEELYDIDCDIKWVNDIHVNGLKICGILAETTETPTGLAVIVGIGINLKSTNFPPAVADVATSIEQETGREQNRDELLKSLTRIFGRFCDLLYSPDGPEVIRELWTERSSYALGKSVRAVLGSETITGITRGIEENGALRIETETGEIKTINAGDVENLRSR